MKCRGVITNYGVELINAPDYPSVHEMPKVVVSFELFDKEEESDLKYDRMNWDGMFLNSKGELNKNTVSNLYQMGFRSDDLIVLSDGLESHQLDIDHEYYLTLEQNDKGYWGIKWINREERSGVKEIKHAAKDVLAKKFKSMKVSGSIKKMMSELSEKDKKSTKTKKDIPNKAPDFNYDEEIPF